MKKTIPIVFLTLVALAAGLLYIKVPYSMRAKGIVKPAREWGIHKAFDGTLVNVLEDHLTGTINEYKVLEFQRGDIVQFLFNNELLRGDAVDEGDTIAWVISNDLKMNIIQKKGALAYEESLLRVYLTGDKPEALRLAENQVELAQQELYNQQKITKRISQLYEQDVVSLQEYELAINDLRVKEYRLEIARSAYESLLAGEKEEEIGAIRARIASLEYQVKHLNDHLADMNILAPISGQIVRQRNPAGTNADEVIKVADHSFYIVFAPIDIFESQFIYHGQSVTIKPTHSHTEIKGTIHDIDNRVQIINRQPKVFVSIIIEPQSTDYRLLPNMVVDARIHHKKVSAGEYLLRKSRIVYQN